MLAWSPSSLWLFSLLSPVLCSPPKAHKPSTSIPYLINSIPPGENFVQSLEYNLGAYGLYVNRTFQSSNVLAPRLNFEKPFTACDDGSYIFVTPRGEVVDSAPYILDVNGSLIWTPDQKYGQVYNLQVQHYKGEPFITFWGGNSDGGHGAGFHYMFDKHYQPVGTIGAIDGQQADLHSFTITPEGTALLTTYDKVNVTGHPLWPSNRETWVWDCRVQEIDIATGELIFQWRALDRFALESSYSMRPFKPDFETPWDWFHINMVEKDELGNYLISARHLRSIIYVAGQTGDLLWSLGGKNNDFTDLSDIKGPSASFFVGQHDAHWDQGHKFLTLFDNRADWEIEVEHVSKGTRLEVDLENMTVKLNMSFVHPSKIFAFSQGSYQTLPNGNVLLGYGYSGAFTEFAPDGTVLCDAYLQPSGRFSSGDVQSYRNLKFNWTGVPLTTPSAVLNGSSLFVSWLGSTETRSWRVQDSRFLDRDFGDLLHVDKVGFETEIPLSEGMALRRYIRITAIDANGNSLAISDAIDIAHSMNTLLPHNITSYETFLDIADQIDYEDALRSEGLGDLELMLGLVLLVVFAALMCFWRTLVPRVASGWRDVPWLREGKVYVHKRFGRRDSWNLLRFSRVRLRSQEDLLSTTQVSHVYTNSDR